MIWKQGRIFPWVFCIGEREREMLPQLKIVNIFAICRAVDCPSLSLELDSNNVLFKSRQIDISSVIINLEHPKRKLSLVFTLQSSISEDIWTEDWYSRIFIFSSVDTKMFNVLNNYVHSWQYHEFSIYLNVYYTA